MSRLVYDLSRRPGHRLVSAVVQCEDTAGAGPQCGELEDSSNYSLVHAEISRFIDIYKCRYLDIKIFIKYYLNVV